VVSGRVQAADEQDVGVLVVRVESDELRGAPHGLGRLPAPEERQRRLVEDRAREALDVPALALEPELEAGARPEGEPFEQLQSEAGQLDRLEPGAAGQHVDVHERAGRQDEAERVAAELHVVAEPAPQRRERPAERPERIFGLREEQHGEPLARGRDARAHEVGEQAPRLVAARSLELGPASLDPRRSKQMDAQPHRTPPTVTRPVTRLTVTLASVEFNTTDERERTCVCERRRL